MEGDFIMLHIINAHVLDVFTQIFEETELWIEGKQIVFRGRSDVLNATETYDAQGAYIAPGLIDAHLHIESSLLRPAELGRLLAKHGVTTGIADPHELASVAGKEGINFMLSDADASLTNFHFMLPSSVPAVDFEHAGAVLKAKDLKEFYAHERVNGLAEVMDFPAVAAQDTDMMQKIADAQALNKRIDGHGSGLTREQLSIYRQAGITSDHEATSVAEAEDRLAAGMHILIRQGTVEQDERALLPAVTTQNQHRFSFSTDDKTVTDIVARGSIDESVAIALAEGLSLEIVLTMASYNAAQAEGLQDVGALNDGYMADLILFDDKENFEVTQTMISGEWVNDMPTNEQQQLMPLSTPLNFSLDQNDLVVPITSDKVHVIGIEPNHITTEHKYVPVPQAEGVFIPNQMFQKIVVAERYHNLGSTTGIISGLDLKQGAIGATVAHDSHNVIIAGVDDAAMLKVADTLRDMNGGLVVALDADTVVAVPLTIGGLMSDQPYEVVAEQYQTLQAAFKEISSVSFDPFITLSFMALPVIPSLKITDQGLFDFDKFTFINVNDEQ